MLRAQSTGRVSDAGLLLVSIPDVPDRLVVHSSIDWEEGIMADLQSHNLGTIIRIEPISPAGRKWWRRNVGRISDGVIDCEHRCGIEILLGALAEGLTVEDVYRRLKA